MLIKNIKLILIIILIMIPLNRCTQREHTEIELCRVLKSKHTEDESINIRGDFRPVYYFLYEDGDLEEVTLQDYMTFEPKDTLCIKYQIEK